MLLLKTDVFLVVSIGSVLIFIGFLLGYIAIAKGVGFPEALMFLLEIDALLLITIDFVFIFIETFRVSGFSF